MSRCSLNPLDANLFLANIFISRPSKAKYPFRGLEVVQKISMCPRSHKLYFLDILLFGYLQNIFSDPVFLILFLNVGEKIIPVLQMLNPFK